VSHLVKGYPCIDAGSGRTLRGPRVSLRCAAAALGRKLRVSGEHGVDAATSSCVPGESVPDPEVNALNLERFKRPVGSSPGDRASSSSDCPDGCSPHAALRARRPVAVRPCSRPAGARSSLVFPSGQSSALGFSAGPLTPSPSSPTRPTGWTCSGTDPSSRLKRFGTAATRCEGSGAAVPTGRLSRSANGFY
jgi:hypothetical protein